MVIFNSYVKLPEGKANEKLSSRDVSTRHSGKIGEGFFLKEFIVGFAHENHENASQT